MEWLYITLLIIWALPEFEWNWRIEPDRPPTSYTGRPVHHTYLYMCFTWPHTRPCTRQMYLSSYPPQANDGNGNSSTCQQPDFVELGNHMYTGCTYGEGRCTRLVDFEVVSLNSIVARKRTRGSFGHSQQNESDCRNSTVIQTGITRCRSERGDN